MPAVASLGFLPSPDTTYDTYRFLTHWINSARTDELAQQGQGQGQGLPCAADVVRNKPDPSDQPEADPRVNESANKLCEWFSQPGRGSHLV